MLTDLTFISVEQTDTSQIIIFRNKLKIAEELIIK